MAVGSGLNGRLGSLGGFSFGPAVPPPAKCNGDEKDGTGERMGKDVHLNWREKSAKKE